jgi:hypothetical protein
MAHRKADLESRRLRLLSLFRKTGFAEAFSVMLPVGVMFENHGHEPDCVLQINPQRFRSLGSSR